MRRGHALRRCAAGLLLALTALAFAPVRASAGGDDGSGPAPLLPRDGEKSGDDAEERARKALEKALDAVAADFEDESTSKLLGGVPKDGTIGLSLGSAHGSYKRKQAAEVLDDWFAPRTILSVKRAKVTGSTGKYDLKFRTTRKDDTQKRTLLLTVEKLKDGSFRLTEITVE